MKVIMMNKKMFLSLTIYICVLLFFCGCTEQSNQDQVINDLIGTWTGQLQTQGIPGGASSAITALTFLDESTVETTMEIGQGSMTMSQSYTLEGTTIIFTQQERNRNQQWNGGEIPPWGNNTQYPGNATNPMWGNHTSPPDNMTNPFGDGQPPQDGERPMGAGQTYTYRFNDDRTVLYLNGAAFTKQ